MITIRLSVDKKNLSSLVARGEERPVGRGEESALLMVKKSALAVAWVKNARRWRAWRKEKKQSIPDQLSELVFHPLG